MQIKTLAEIMAELDDKPSSNKPSPKSQPNISKQPKAHKKSAKNFSAKDGHDCPNIVKTNNPATNQATPTKTTQYTSYNAKNKHKSSLRLPKKAKRFHPAAPYTPKSVSKDTRQHQSLSPNDVKAIILGDNQEQAVNNKNENNESPIIDNLTEKLKSTLKTDQERQAELEELKANSRLRWLAFYYLSRREHSAAELKDKLIAKDQDPDKIDALLEEFAQKGYQSDHRTAMMLIREGIRKGRGRMRIKQTFYKRKVALPSNIDELIDMETQDSDAFAEVVSDHPLIDGVDWLKLAVEARVKKYGDALPTTPKDKARQLRFLQYRGFNPNICFEAIKYSCDSLEDRY